MAKEQNKRRYERYNTEVKVSFRVDYKLQTRVEYQLVGKEEDKILSKRYFGVSRNVGPEGLCFVSEQKLNREDILALEVYLPGDDDNPIYMLGEVRWSEEIKNSPGPKKKFTTGVKLYAVNNQPVAPSISFDEKKKTYWSLVLESIFGKDKKLKVEKEEIP